MKTPIIALTKEEIIAHIQAWAHKYNRLTEEINALRIQADAIHTDTDNHKFYELMLNVHILESRANATLNKLNGKFDMLSELTDVFIYCRMNTEDCPNDYRNFGGTLNTTIHSIVYDWNFSTSDGKIMEEIPVYSVQEQ